MESEIDYTNVITMADYECPKHGNIKNDVMVSNLKGHEGLYCLYCWMEAIEASGVQKVKMVEKKKDG